MRQEQEKAIDEIDKKEKIRNFNAWDTIKRSYGKIGTVGSVLILIFCLLLS